MSGTPEELIAKAIETISAKKVIDWCRENLGEFYNHVEEKRLIKAGWGNRVEIIFLLVNEIFSPSHRQATCSAELAWLGGPNHYLDNAVIFPLRYDIK